MQAPPSQRSDTGRDRASKPPVAGSIYQYSGFREVCGQLALSQLSGRDGTFLLLGQRRVGKSTLIGHSLRYGRSFGKAVLVTCEPRMSVADLLLALSEQAGTLGLDRSQLEALSGEPGLTVPDWASLEQSLEAAGRITIVLDSAERAPDPVLEMAYRLSTVGKDRDRRLSLILVGRLELAGRLDSPALLDLKGGIAFRAILEPVPDREVAAFVTSLLETEYPNRAVVFSDDALARIARASFGLPETIVRICRAAIDIASTVPSRRINLTIANQAVASLAPERAASGPDATVVFEPPSLKAEPWLIPAAGLAGGAAPAEAEEFDGADLESDQDWPSLPDFELEDYEVEASTPEDLSAPPVAELSTAGARAPLSHSNARRATVQGFAVGLALGLMVTIGVGIGLWLIAGSDGSQETAGTAGLPASETGRAADLPDQAGLASEQPAQVLETAAPTGARTSAGVPDAMVMTPAPPDDPGRPADLDLGLGDPIADRPRVSTAMPLADRTGRDDPAAAGSAPIGQTRTEGLIEAERADLLDLASAQPANGETPERPAPDDAFAPAVEAMKAESRMPDPGSGTPVQTASERAQEAGSAAGATAALGPGPPATAAESRPPDREDPSEFVFRNDFERSLTAIKRRDIQQALTVLKLNPGRPDGVIGRRTREAIRTFQASLGLPPTGELEPKLVSLLFNRADTATAVSATVGRSGEAAADPTRALPAPPGGKLEAGTAGRSEPPARGRYPDESEVEWLERLATEGDKLAQSNLGQRYYHGNGVRRDLGTAAKWYRLAAEQGDAAAQTNLGRLYFNGEGVALDKRKAAEWSLAAALQGNATAQFNLGLMYKHGSGIDKDLMKASHWLRKAAENGEPGARPELDQVTAELDNPSQ